MLSKKPKERMEDIEERINRDDIDNDVALRILRAKLTWRDWILHDWLRYWYGVGAMALNVFLLLWLLQSFQIRDILGISLLLVVTVILASMEFVGYRLLWSGGVLSRKQD